MNKVACVILNYFTWEDTINEIEHVHEKLNIKYEDVIIVDNNSPNDSYVKLLEYGKIKNIVIIQSEKNGGYAAGNNIGIKYAERQGYKYVLVINNDIIITDSKMLTILKTVLEKDTSVAVVSPDIYMPNGHLCNRDAVRPNFFDFTIGMYSYKKRGRIIHDKGGYGYVYRPQGCCMLMNIKKIVQIDYMDERTFLYCEESILAERLLKENYKCACAISTSIIHNHSVTVKTALEKKKTNEIVQESFEYYLEDYRKYNRLKIFICKFFNQCKMLLLD